MAKTALTRQQMADRLAQEFQDGWIVNLGAGIPNLCTNYLHKDRAIIYHSENGVIGYGPMQREGQEDPHLVDAGGQYVTLNPGTAIVHHADSFALIRKGLLDVTVMGSYEVAENGDFANYKLAGSRGGSIGGAMDLAVHAKRVFIVMEHNTREGRPRLLRRCTLPVTGKGVVSLVMTNLGLFEVTRQGFLMREIAPGYTLEEIQALTEAKLIVPNNLQEMKA